MGTDLHVCAGKFEPATEGVCKEALVSGELSFPKIFELMKAGVLECYTGDGIPEEYTRSYSLFGFLTSGDASLGGWVQPILGTKDNYKALHEETMSFLKFYKNLKNKDMGFGSEVVDNWSIGVRGDWGHTFYPLVFLKSFDYDQVAIVCEKVCPLEEVIWERHPEGMTYRELFSDWYFKMLDDFEKQGVDFVIFSFDN